MKTFVALASLLVVMLVGWSCQKEISFEGGGLPSMGNRHCIDCPYLPFCDSSEFTYLVDGTDTATGPVFVLGDTLLGGQSFAQVSAIPGFGRGILYSCTNGDYRMAMPLSGFGVDPDSIRLLLTPLLDSLLPVPADPSSLYIPTTFFASLLKANSPQGSTWLDTLTAITVPFNAGPLTLNVRIYAGIEYTYLEKNSSHTVLGRSYPNTQHVQGKPKIGVATQFPIPIPLPLPAIDGQLDFYLAKDVGVVEMRATDSTGVRNSAQLISYRL